jgi:hypothetical protein
MFTVSPRDDLQRPDVEHRLSQELLELAVLVLELPPLPNIRLIHPDKVAAPLVERGVAAVLAPELLHGRYGLHLLPETDGTLRGADEAGTSGYLPSPSRLGCSVDRAAVNSLKGLSKSTSG